MSKYQSYKVLEQRLQAELEKLEALKNDKDVAAAAAKEGEFKELTAEIGCPDFMAMAIEVYGLAAVNAAIAPFNSKGEEGKRGAGTRTPRQRKRWTHPETGETFEGGKAGGPVLDWIKEHGKEKVATWAVGI